MSFREQFSRPTSEDRAFQQLIQKDPDICNNCFRQTHDTVEQNYFFTTYNGEPWAKKVEGRGTRSWPRPDELKYMPGDEPTDGTFSVCKCGVPHDTVRPVSFDRAMEHCKRLVGRLNDKDVEFDESRFWERVQAELKRPENQGKQDSVFADAVTASLTSW